MDDEEAEALIPVAAATEFCDLECALRRFLVEHADDDWISTAMYDAEICVIRSLDELEGHFTSRVDTRGKDDADKFDRCLSANNITL